MIRIVGLVLGPRGRAGGVDVGAGLGDPARPVRRRQGHLHRGEPGHVHVGSPKSGKARVVPIPRLLIDALTDQSAEKGDDALVFPNLKGSYLRAGKWWDAARIRAGVPYLSPTI